MTDQPPPNWYYDGVGLRWWDGAQWGAYAPQAPPPHPDEASKTPAILAHIGFVVGGFIVPLIIFIIQDKGSFGRHHGAEALNFQLATMIATFGSIAIGVAGLIIQQPGGNEFPWGLLLMFPLIFAITIANYVFSIIGMVKASRLERWRYPITIRFFKA